MRLESERLLGKTFIKDEGGESRNRWGNLRLDHDAGLTSMKGEREGRIGKETPQLQSAFERALARPVGVGWGWSLNSLEPIRGILHQAELAWFEEPHGAVSGWEWPSENVAWCDPKPQQREAGNQRSSSQQVLEKRDLGRTSQGSHVLRLSIL